MPAADAISPAILARLIGTRDGPLLLDLRAGATDRIPGASRQMPADSARRVVVIDETGGAAAQAAAARLRHDGIAAEWLEGGPMPGCRACPKRRWCAMPRTGRCGSRAAGPRSTASPVPG